MSRFTVFILFIFAILFSCTQPAPAPQTYERIERVQSGAVTRRVQIVDGKKEGKMTDYYPEGQLVAERWLKNDKQEGRTLIFYPGGKIKEVQYYKEGLQQDGDTIWYENGQIQFTSYHLNDLKNGYLRKWSPEGKLIFECRYANDTLVEVKGQKIIERQ
jgi:antitoxin component YwqK of YwqJK toxin-antitoxin module